MSYYFPSPITNLNFPEFISSELVHTFDSGKSALRVALKSLNLSVKSKVAIPAYVCKDVKYSVEAEILTPVLFDLKDDQTFWTDYNFERIKNEKINAIILVHLYGFIHPDTELITGFCKKNNIYLIHDAAQSYGINEQKLKAGNAVVYSFGPGKVTSMAGGGWVKYLTNHNYTSCVKKASFMSFQNTKAIHFFKSRIYNFKFSKKEIFLNSIINLISKPLDGIFEMSAFQKKSAAYILSMLNEIKPLRKKRYLLIKQKIFAGKKLNVAYDDDNGAYVKTVIFVKDQPAKFKAYLKSNSIPYFSLIDSEQNKNSDQSALPNFQEYAGHFFEISTEASIPEPEIVRVANIIAAW